MIPVNSFCKDDSCTYYRYNEQIFDNPSREGSHNFFCFKYIMW